jgi:hypothetical protein
MRVYWGGEKKQQDEGGRSERVRWENMIKVYCMQGVIMKPIFKNSGRTGGMVQVIERLPSKCEAQSSNPSTVKKKLLVESRMGATVLGG